jgi:hypothetical protein
MDHYEKPTVSHVLFRSANHESSKSLMDPEQEDLIMESQNFRFQR